MHKTHHFDIKNPNNFWEETPSSDPNA